MRCTCTAPAVCGARRSSHLLDGFCKTHGIAHKGVYQLKGGIQRYMEAVEDGSLFPDAQGVVGGAGAGAGAGDDEGENKAKKEIENAKVQQSLWKGKNFVFDDRMVVGFNINLDTTAEDSNVNASEDSASKNPSGDGPTHKCCDATVVVGKCMKCF